MIFNPEAVARLHTVLKTTRIYAEMPSAQIADALSALIDSSTEVSEIAIIPVIAELQRRIFPGKFKLLPAALQGMQDRAARMTDKELTQLLQQNSVADSIMVQEAMFRVYPKWCEEGEV